MIGTIMGAVFVMMVAFIGGGYFYLQEKKSERRHRVKRKGV
jgi:hypothetical protein